MFTMNKSGTFPCSNRECVNIYWREKVSNRAWRRYDGGSVPTSGWQYVTLCYCFPSSEHTCEWIVVNWIRDGWCFRRWMPRWHVTIHEKTLCRWFIAHNTKCCYFVLIKVVSRWKRFTCCVGYVKTGHIKSLVFSVYWGYVLIGRNYENKIIVTLTLIFILERTGGNQCRGFASI